MAAMLDTIDKPDSPLATTVKWRFPSVHPEGRKFVVIARRSRRCSASSWAGTFLGWLLIGADDLGRGLLPRSDPRPRRAATSWSIAPADGLVTMIAKVPPPPELRGAEGMADGEYTRVSIFMSVFDVHINRSPIAGRITRIAYVPGKFVNADLDKASEDNERQHFLVEGADGLEDRLHPDRGPGRAADPVVRPGRRSGRGRPARRPDPLRQPGRRLSARRDRAAVLLGQRSIAGETVIGEIGVDPALAGISQ